MGLVGAGAAIEPDFGKVPPAGLHTVDLPFPVPDGLIGFEVRGDAMLPRYDDGDVIVVWREQRRPTEGFIGEEAAVRTEEGRRYLKHVLPRAAQRHLCAAQLQRQADRRGRGSPGWAKSTPRCARRRCGGTKRGGSRPGQGDQGRRPRARATAEKRAR